MGLAFTPLLCRPDVGAPPQEVTPSLPVFILIFSILLANSTLALLAVLFPERAVRVHARLCRLLYETTLGPDWEGYMERYHHSKRFIEYLRRAPYEPLAFPDWIRKIHLFFILYGMMSLILLGVWCYAFVSSFWGP